MNMVFKLCANDKDKDKDIDKDKEGTSISKPNVERKEWHQYCTYRELG
jgi:hypothetical protein